jgi:hypothetical protein
MALIHRDNSTTYFITSTMHVKVSMAKLEVISVTDFPISQIQRADLSSDAHTTVIFLSAVNLLLFISSRNSAEALENVISTISFSFHCAMVKQFHFNN